MPDMDNPFFELRRQLDTSTFWLMVSLVKLEATYSDVPQEIIDTAMERLRAHQKLLQEIEQATLALTKVPAIAR